MVGFEQVGDGIVTIQAALQNSEVLEAAATALAESGYAQSQHDDSYKVVSDVVIAALEAVWRCTGADLLRLQSQVVLRANEL